MSKKIAVFDLDGVLAEYHGWREDGSIGNPIPLGIELLFRMVEAGFDIVVQSCRTNVTQTGGGETQYSKIRRWLNDNHLDFARIETSGKAMGNIYFDDRAIHIPLNLAGFKNTEYIFISALAIAKESTSPSETR